MKLLKVSALCAAAVIALAGCNKNEVVNNLIPSDMETAYAKVKISMAGATGTRATEDGGYDKGSEKEFTVSSLTILLFDNAGQVVGVGSTNTFVGEDPEDQTKDYTKYTTGTITVTLDPGNAKPEQLLAFVNSPTIEFQTLDQAKEALVSVTNTNGEKFVMTNALGKGHEVVTSVDFEKNFASTVDELTEDSTIDIFVERLAAKITVAEKQGTEKDPYNTTSDIDFYDVKDNVYKIVFTPYRWAATGTAREMYAFKHGDEEFPTWADVSDWRTNWAYGVNYDTPYGDYVGNNKNHLRYLTANQVISENGVGLKLGDAPFYVNEHTFGEEAMNEGEYAPVITGTNAIIVGQYKVVGDNADDKFKIKDGAGEDAYDFYVALRGSQYTIYNEEDLINYLLNANSVASDNNGTQISKVTDFLELTKEKESGKYVLAVKEGKTVYYSTDETEWNELTNEKAATFGSSNSKHYRFGWAYFFAPIEHNYVDNKTLGSYGVVRNHSYKLTINKITGLGAPLDEGKIGEDPKHSDPKDPDDPDPDPDPEDPGDEPIIPDPEDTKTAYIDATLNVLYWHVISQGVDL